MQKVQAIRRPFLRSQRNLHNLIENTGSLVSSESHWIREGPDLAALGCTANDGWLENIIGNLSGTTSRTIARVSAQDHSSYTSTPV